MYRRLNLGLAASAVVLVAASLIAAGPASGKERPRAVNGAIAFSAPVSGGGTQVFTVNPDGTGLQQVTHSTAQAGWAGLGWNPDGAGLIYTVVYPSGPDQMFTSLADGTNPTLISPSCTGTCLGDDTPAYSADGTKIAFNRAFGPIGPPPEYNAAGVAIFTMSADGTNVKQITPIKSKLYSGYQQPQWSPDGTSIAFVAYATFLRKWVGGDGNGPHAPSAIVIMNANGSDVRRLTSWWLDATDPYWSPNGKLLLFNSHNHPVVGESANLYTMRPNGTGLVELTHGSGGCPQSWAQGWSPDGTRILFSYFHLGCPGPMLGSLHIMNVRTRQIRRLPTPGLGVTTDDIAAWGRKPG